jgi:hypothetical protein
MTENYTGWGGRSAGKGRRSRDEKRGQSRHAAGDKAAAARSTPPPRPARAPSCCPRISCTCTRHAIRLQTSSRAKAARAHSAAAFAQTAGRDEWSGTPRNRGDERRGRVIYTHILAACLQTKRAPKIGNVDKTQECLIPPPTPQLHVCLYTVVRKIPSMTPQLIHFLWLCGCCGWRGITSNCVSPSS